MKVEGVLRRRRGWGFGKSSLWVALVVAVAFDPILTGVAGAEEAYPLAWVRQFGSASADICESMAADGVGGVYLAGVTQGDLGGANVGEHDVFLARCDPSGELLWATQIGTSGTDIGESVAADGAGGVYLAGTSWAGLAGPHAGQADAFLRRYDDSGQLQWSRQLGTEGSDLGLAVAADAGGVYLSGRTDRDLGGPNSREGTSDAYLAKYDNSGSLLWTRQLGTTEADTSFAVATDGAGSIYICGETEGSLGGTNPSPGVDDVFLAKYDASGSLLWTRQIGSARTDRGSGVVADATGAVYITGDTWGSLAGPNAGERDAFLAKYDASGNLLWSRQFGTETFDSGRFVAADGAGGVYVSGNTHGSLGGLNAGNEDVFLAKYDASGDLLWTHQIGTAARERAGALVVDGAGAVLLSGSTAGDLGGLSAGDYDIFLAKYVVPEPATLVLLGLGAAGLMRRRRRRGGKAVVLMAALVVGASLGATPGSARAEEPYPIEWTRQLGTSVDDYRYGVATDPIQIR